MDGVERPLSPHLGIYRWQITNSLSILHRMTGLFVSIGALVLVCWLVALASGPEAYAGVQGWYGSGWFKAPLIGWSFCFFYHLANGVRHLCWDAGAGFERAQIRAGGWAVIVFAVLATAAYSMLAIL